MAKTEKTSRENLPQIIEASRAKYDDDKKTENEIFNKYFPSLYEKAGCIATLVGSFKSVTVDDFVKTKEMIDEIQRKIDDLRLYIYRLGTARDTFYDWLNHLIPSLISLECDLRSALQAFPDKELYEWLEREQEQGLSEVRRRLLYVEDRLLNISKILLKPKQRFPEEMQSLLIHEQRLLEENKMLLNQLLRKDEELLSIIKYTKSGAISNFHFVTFQRPL